MATALSGLIILIGLVGVVFPVLPGLILVWAGVLVWALFRHDAHAWAFLAVATAIAAAGSTVKYLLPGRRLRDSGVPWTTLAAGAALGLVGFFVVPLVGLPLGFVLGVYLAEWGRLGSSAAAWPSTRSSIGAVGVSILIELLTAALVTLTWVIGALVWR